MALADIARKTDRLINTLGTRHKAKAGWRPRAVGYYGYGDQKKVRVLGRVLMQDPREAEPGASIAAHAQRGFRQFFTVQVGNQPVRVRAGKRSVDTRSDEGGYIDVLIDDHGLPPGWQSVTIEVDGAVTQAEVQILPPETRVGLISDIDDTVMVTMLPRAMIAAYNSWYLRTNARKAVPGMPEFYAGLSQHYPEMPVFYLSTGAWNTFPALTDFLADHHFPKGPMLLTDWGPTPTGMFRSGMEHKRVQLRNLIIDFPDITWILVGDDGQHDPLIYGNLAAEHPARIAGIAIRELSPGEHVLSHGTVAPIEPADKAGRGDTPYVMGSDGFELLDAWSKNPFLDS